MPSLGWGTPPATSSSDDPLAISTPSPMPIRLVQLPSLEPVRLDHWQADDKPLVFDLDGTLVAGDTARRIWAAALGGAGAWSWPKYFGLSHDAIALSAKIWSFEALESSDKIQAVLAQMDLNLPIIEHAKSAQTARRELWLVSGTLQPVAELLAQRLQAERGLQFSVVKASAWPINLVAQQKAKWLAETCPGGFDYVGDHPVQDQRVWQAARRGYRVLS